MNRRVFLKNAGAGGLAIGSGGLLRGAAGTQDWNILVMTSDEHNPKIMGCAGNSVIRTAAIDCLAREGTMFTRAYCADPICAPTRQSVMTCNYSLFHLLEAP
jgi:choline-sulfatase